MKLPVQMQQHGFSLIELMVGVVIVAILTAVGAPAIKNWMKNAQIRGTADAIQSGLQLARAEAVSRNTLVRFQLTTSLDASCVISALSPTNITSNWVVSQDDATGACDIAPSDTVVPRIIQKRSAAEGSSEQVQLTADQTSFVFTGLGRLTTNTTATFSLSNPSGGDCIPLGSMRCLNIKVTPGGQVRMCDPTRPATDSQGC